MTKLRILAVEDPAVYGYIEPSFKIIENYELYEGIKIDFDIVDFKAYYETLMSTFASYTYDIVMIAGHLWLKNMVSKGFLKPLDQKDDEDIIPSIRQEMKLDGITYLSPSFCDGHMLVYRNSMVCHKLDHQISIKKLIDLVNQYEGYPKIALKAHPSELFLDVLPYVLSFHGPIFVSHHRLNIDSELLLEGLYAYKQMMNVAPNDTQTFDNNAIKDQIQQKKVPYAVTWGGQLGRIYNESCVEKEDLRFVALKESWNVTWSFAIPHNTDKYDEALKFMNYLTESSVDRMIGGYSGNPVRVSSYIIDQHKYPWYQNLLEMINHANHLPNHENLGEIMVSLTDLFIKYLNDHIDDNEVKSIVLKLNEGW